MTTRYTFHKAFGSISDVIAERRRDQKMRQHALRQRQLTAREADDWESFWEESLAPRVPASHCMIKET